jgi:hypothetical protein
MRGYRRNYMDDKPGEIKTNQIKCPFAIETKNWNHCRGVAVMGKDAKIVRYCELHPEYTCIIKEGLGK